jgi:prepilin-type N-terminal cleavage/methylation domain-containing protein
MGRDAGFTLVELLVVMLILGLLAGIAVPSFFAQRDKARDADAKVAAKTAQLAAETVATDNDGPEGVTVANLRAVEETLQDADLSVPAVGAKTYTVRVRSVTGNDFDITRQNDGSYSLACTNPGTAGCPPSGDWD